MIVTVALMFLLNLNWEVWWPMMIIIPGVATWFMGGVQAGVGGTAVLRLGRWFGFMMVAFSASPFLADQLNLISLQTTVWRFSLVEFLHL